jgi:hypothetical protein
MAATPVVEAAVDVAREERWARRVAASGRQSEHGTGGGYEPMPIPMRLAG